jgi:hypothetical protein
MAEMIKIWSSPEIITIEGAQNILKEKGMDSFIMDKRDSSYPGILGSVELYVSEDIAEEAKSILEEELVDE